MESFSSDVFQLLNELAEGKIAPDAWREKCKELGVIGAPLCLRVAEETTPDLAAAARVHCAKKTF